MKRLIVIFLILAMVLCIASCGGTSDTPPEVCTEHTDTNKDGKCDTCGTAIEPPKTTECTEHIDSNDDGKCDVCDATLEKEHKLLVKLIEDSNPLFTFVLGNDISADVVSTFNDYVIALRLAGISVTTVTENDAAAECEVLIGNVTSRGDKYVYDTHTLGKDGYAIKAIESKVIVTGGDTDSLMFAVEVFFEDILGFDLTTGTAPENASLTTENEIVEVQTNYRVEDITVAGTSIRGGSIAVDTESTRHYEMALFVQDAIYTTIGEYLPVVSLGEAKSNSIVIRKVEDDGEYGFKIYADGSALTVECAYDNSLEKTLTDFVNREIRLGDGIVSFDSGYLYNKVVRIVTYEEFGAVGDGRTDDFLAIRDAHVFANECGQTVVGRVGRTYLIQNATSTIPIKTDVIWENVKFTIDDRGIPKKDANNRTIFKVESDYSAVVIKDKAIIEKIFSGTTVAKDFAGQLNWSDFGYEAMISVANTKHRNFIRYGANANSGSVQKEIIVVSADGDIRDDTPFMFDYENINELTIYRMDERHITIKGGKFTTIANDIPQTKEDWGYYSRNFTVNRSYTTVDGLEHYIKGELPGVNVSGNTDPKGAPYSGFMSVSTCSDVKLLNCVLTGRRCSGIAGTYDFSAGNANNLYLYNVKQSNYYKDDGETPSMDYKYYWGIGGTNYCKNLTYDTCVLSRFDAHCGLYNGKVINSTICNFELIGAGDMLIENTTITPVSNTPIMLRGDYGCTWRGTLTVKDVTVRFATTTASTALISAGWNNHYFGYTCYMPNIVIDNLKWENLTNKNVVLCSFKEKDFVFESTLYDGTVNNNIYIPPKYIKVTNTNGYNYTLPGTPFYNEVDTIEGVEIMPINN